MIDYGAQLTIVTSNTSLSQWKYILFWDDAIMQIGVP